MEVGANSLPYQQNQIQKLYIRQYVICHEEEFFFLTILLTKFFWPAYQAVVGGTKCTLTDKEVTILKLMKKKKHQGNCRYGGPGARYRRSNP